MDPEKVAALAAAGHQLLIAKWFSVSMYCLWVYDYFLTLGDEVTYAWSGRKSRVFVLFIANRYLPWFHIAYKFLIMFGYTQSLCERSKWEINLYTTTVAFLAQITIALRLYAVTGRNKILGGIACVLVIVQLVSGLWFTAVTGVRPMQQLPQINIDPFRICFFRQWRPGEFSFIILAITFDLFAFFMVLTAARGPGMMSHTNVPSLLKTILRDATIYFFLMFICQLVLFFFLFLAPVSIQLLPGITHAIFLPMMACRLMLSLRKAASETTELWSLSNTSQGGRRRSTGGNIEFVGFDTSCETSDSRPSPSEADVELGSLPRLPQDSGTQ